MKKETIEIIENSKGKYIYNTEWKTLMEQPIKSVANNTVRTKGYVASFEQFGVGLESGLYELRDKPINYSEDKKRTIEVALINLFCGIGMEQPENFDNIVDFVFEDVCETADPEKWNDSDIVIGFRRYIESKNF